MITILLSQPQRIPLWTLLVNNCSFDEHLPPSCIDSVIEVLDPRLGPIQFFSGEYSLFR